MIFYELNINLQGRNNAMSFRIFRYYILICREINVIPSFEGLRQFEKFYEWEMGTYDRF